MDFVRTINLEHGTSRYTKRTSNKFIPRKGEIIEEMYFSLPDTCEKLIQLENYKFILKCESVVVGLDLKVIIRQII